MSYDGMKLIYFDGKPQWLMPDGSFVPAKSLSDGSYEPFSLYIRDRVCNARRLIGS
jgi:hypothetical protein